MDQDVEAHLRRAPKVALHDHLDGGLRPQTVLDLAAEIGHALPAQSAPELGEWFYAAADSGSLDRYLETFAHTVAVMQTQESLARVAREFALDQVDDGVIYAEARFAPEQHQQNGLSLDQVVEAVASGLAEGERQAAAEGSPIRCGILVTAMRQGHQAREVAEVAVRHRDRYAVGFDIAGPEIGFPPSLHLDAFDYLHRESFPVTIHAGEAVGLDSIWEAVQLCGAQRLGHGVRIIDGITAGPDGVPRLDRLPAWVRDRRIPLELCPSSNVQTGAAASVATHPISRLRDLGFVVTINCDNRLMSGTTMTREMCRLVTEAGWSLGDLRAATVAAMQNAFLPWDERTALIDAVIEPGWARAIEHQTRTVPGPGGQGPG
ncbi:MAG: adenosine deaminase [Actinomycetales bacterium]